MASHVIAFGMDETGVPGFDTHVWIVGPRNGRTKLREASTSIMLYPVQIIVNIIPEDS